MMPRTPGSLHHHPPSRWVLMQSPEQHATVAASPTLSRSVTRALPPALCHPHSVTRALPPALCHPHSVTRALSPALCQPRALPAARSASARLTHRGPASAAPRGHHAEPAVAARCPAGSTAWQSGTRPQKGVPPRPSPAEHPGGSTWPVTVTCCIARDSRCPARPPAVAAPSPAASRISGRRHRISVDSARRMRKIAAGRPTRA
jgi:hypothetical protein